MTAKKRRKKRGRWFQVRLQFTRQRKIERNKRRRKDRKYSSLFQNYNSIPHKIDTESFIRRKFPGFSSVFAPKIFSLIKNEKEVIDFQYRLKDRLEKRKKVLVRLENVEELSNEAIMILLSIMVEFRSSGIDFNGTKPLNRDVAVRLDKSGFFNHLYRNLSPKDEYNIQKVEGQIYTHGQKTLSSRLADDIVKYSSESIWGEPRRCPGVQKTLVELMHNTFDHASPDKGAHHWWLSVERNTDSSNVTISFIDYGIGIFGSLSNKSAGDPLHNCINRIRSLFPSAEKQHEQLKLILQGKVHLSQSKEYYRGKGLSKIYKHFSENRISSLFILSNYASANVSKDDYHSLDKEFPGTFVSFTINNSTFNLPWTI